jgi:hypothetical protein
LCEEFEKKKKKEQNFLDLPERGFEPQIFSNFPMIWIFMESEEPEIKANTMGTGKSLSEALIFASINPKYDNRLVMEWAEHVLPMFCACSFHGNSMNNLLSYCGLVDARISASEKDLPV